MDMLQSSCPFGDLGVTWVFMLPVNFCALALMVLALAVIGLPSALMVTVSTIKDSNFQQKPHLRSHRVVFVPSLCFRLRDWGVCFLYCMYSVYTFLHGAVQPCVFPGLFQYICQTESVFKRQLDPLTVR